MKVLIDGKEVECLNDVKVIWDNCPEDDMELHMAVTYEGIILDKFTVQNDSDETGLCQEGTASIENSELAEFCDIPNYSPFEDSLEYHESFS